MYRSQRHSGSGDGAERGGRHGAGEASRRYVHDAQRALHERPFELLLVREAPRTLTSRFINHSLQDADGEPVVYEAGEAVVSGHWFQWLGAGNPLLYELCDEVWAANKRDTVDFTPREGFPTVTVPVSQVVRRAIELTPVHSRSANKSGAKTIQRFLLHADTLEMLEEELDA
jgi:hypothetical protein